MKGTFLLLAFYMASSPSYAQPARETKEAIGNLMFMEGVWKGIGWTKVGEKRQQFRETETVTRKLNGNALLLEAFGTAVEDSTNIINNALGVLSYSETTKKYTLRIHMSDGSLGEADATITQPSTLEWRLKYAGGYLKYIIEVKSKIWREKGYQSSDSANWTPIFNMELSKE
jgi:hypothetical protein